MEEIKKEDLIIKEGSTAITEENIYDYNKLSEEDKKEVTNIMKNIEDGDSNSVIQYGVGAQSEIANFSNKMLEDVRAKDTDYVGDILSNLMVKVKNTDVNGFIQESPLENIPVIGKLVDKTKRFFAKYQKIESQIDEISEKLDNERTILLKDIVMFDNLFEKNTECIHNLDLYIIAGNKKIEELKTKILPEMQKKAEETKDPLNAQKVADMSDFTARFEKKIHDLKLTRAIAIQTAPQIRFIQSGNKALVDRIQSSILNTIPLWKSQIVLAIGIIRQKGALDLQKQVTETTNELLKKNSEMLKTNTIEIAKENEKGIVELETLKKVNDDLITTIEETIKISEEGRVKRKEVEKELVVIEKDLKDKLLNTKNN